MRSEGEGVCVLGGRGEACAMGGKVCQCVCSEGKGVCVCVCSGGKCVF